MTFFPSDISQKPVAIAEAAIKEARLKFIDVVIVDTAGRLHIDAEMMGEIQQLHAAIKPVETLFVVDAMTGQDAANTAKAFGDALPLTGAVPRCRSVPLPGSRSSSSVWVKRAKRSTPSIRTGSLRGSSAWATCSA